MVGLPHPAGIATRFRVNYRPWTRDERAVVSRVIFTRDYRDREVPSDAHFRAVLVLQRNLEEQLSMGFDQFVRTAPRPSENDVVIGFALIYSQNLVPTRRQDPSANGEKILGPQSAPLPNLQWIRSDRSRKKKKEECRSYGSGSPKYDQRITATR
ncbi:unnamed protein product [Bursaphelenchus xylophilus]|uniref:(pine wood nematode) hypothetical protein n=1 Tax=Bursaphelenchus xylophilus TaxID=6326 RepID=A0A1I7SE66_BURXY|nr:unnamed protein product [Bursaphelenchus xylophilus]CAG9088579.1 unnamed protein product [Bursaphelenchus xylophilus]